MSLRVPLLLALCVPFAASCFQTLDTTADDGTIIEAEPGELTRIPGGGKHGGIPTLTETPEIEQEALPGEEGIATTKDACEATTKSVRVILQTYCATCHEQGAQSSAGFDFVMDVPKLTSTLTTTGSHYIVPGDCASSLIYQKIVTRRMPPPPLDKAQVSYPSPTVSDISVLHHWITNCLGGTPPTKEPTPDAGAPPAREAGAPPATRDAAAPRPEAAVTPPPPVVTADAGRPADPPPVVVDAGREGGVFMRGDGGGGGGATPCAGICQNPTRFTPPFMSGNLGMNAACFETTTTPTNWTCANFDFMRALSINGTRVNCAQLQPPTAIAPRNGGYCLQAPAGGNQAASFTAQ